MYTIARRLDVPLCVRIHATIWFRRSATKNMRSASPRCAIENTETRGRPSLVRRSTAGSSGSPSSHCSKPGAASRPFNRMASSKRSLAGKNDSRSTMPTFWNDGVCTCWMSDARSTSAPPRQAVVKTVESSVCSRLRGWASIPARARRLVAAVDARSASNSASSRAAAGGAENELSTDTGSPAVLPGV
jgi:hypothetical protein